MFLMQEKKIAYFEQSVPKQRMANYLAFPHTPPETQKCNTSLFTPQCLPAAGLGKAL
jgi:predicted RecB family nuclease